MYPSHVVGIGASAGGLEALQSFFSEVDDKTQFSFVVIQHLSTDYESMMDKLLARHTSMPIQVVEEPTELLADHIYLISSKHNVVATKDRLRPVAKEEKPALNLPIDTFFHSLAAHHQGRAIGIILSGSGTDGSRGIKAIKEEGGIVMVQTPNTAKFDGMPRATQTSGLADFSLSVPELAQEINRLATDASSPSISPDDEHLADDQILRTILSLVFDKTGNDFHQHRPPTLLRRIDKRAKIVRCYSLQDYYQYLEQHDNEVRLLAEEFSIGVSSFFRDKHVWDIFQKKVVPELFDREKEGEVVRIWVPGCTTGEEAYTIAILLSEYQAQHRHVNFKIFASDIDKKALAKAGIGEFSESIVHDVDAFWLEKYFKRTNQGYRVDKKLRDNVIFSVHNLISDPSFIRMDLISCRNTLIYIKPNVQQRIFKNFHYALQYQSYLILGMNESLGEVRSAFEAVAPHTNIFKNVRREKFDRHTDQSFTTDKKKAADRHIFISPPTSPENTASASDHYAAILNDEHAPTSVFVDEEFTILYLHGDVEQVLMFPRKHARLNLLNMVGAPERRLIRNGVKKAREDRSSVHYENITFHRGDEVKSLNLRFKEVWHEPLRQKVMLVEFVRPRPSSNETFSVTHDQITTEQIEMLEQEVHQRDQQLQSLSEQLETSNEELQASNEELQASNEELQSANEELQSVNEELYTVNGELKQKVEELVASNNDINNLLTSTDIATIFLDDQLRVRMLTPRVEEVINIRPKDLGSPLLNFTTRLKRNRLESDMKKVQETGQPVRREVETKAGKFFFQQVLPYRKGEDTRDGIVITFVDISDTKKARSARLSAEKKTREAKNRLEMVIESLKVGIWEWHPSSGKADWNQHMKELFDFGKDEFDGKFDAWFSRIHPDDIKRVEAAFQDTSTHDTPLDVEFRVLWKNQSIYHIYAQGRMVSDKKGAPLKMVGTCVDLTQRKSAEEEALRYGQLLESSHNEIYICDARTLRFINVNRGALKNIGYSLEEMKTLTLLDIAPQLDRRQFQELITGLEEKGEDSVQFETTHQRQDGSHYHVLTTLQETRYSNRNVFVLIVQDITEQAIFNAQLLETNRQLKMANEYLDNFVFTAAHDLRSPVANLTSLVQLLEHQSEAPPAPQIVKKIGVSVERLDSTLSSLIKIINIQQYGKDGAAEVDLEQTYRSIISDLEATIQEAQAEITADFLVDKFHYVPAYLESVLRNLLSNALKYRSAERVPLITVCAERQDAYVVLAVADNGIGIDLDRFKNKLFKPFERLTQQANGKGIGMHLVKTMVEKNGGYLDVASQPNKGTTFKAYLRTYDSE